MTAAVEERRLLLQLRHWRFFEEGIVVVGGTCWSRIRRAEWGQWWEDRRRRVR
ncbi:hypothetical protein RHMOL_Rhmol10G0101600 [Rhododendron molle]|uniref:Uncharacterized protein n=1 Tax=Rhododendron molle TaxID=49168 RepID=A0ACC0M0V6_RHOML|nr:hypothetical protein RHMOL_Rhmol10G0101600 [Rhododendron molle]